MSVGSVELLIAAEGSCALTAVVAGDVDLESPMAAGIGCPLTAEVAGYVDLESLMAELSSGGTAGIRFSGGRHFTAGESGVLLELLQVELLLELLKDGSCSLSSFMRSSFFSSSGLFIEDGVSQHRLGGKRSMSRILAE